MRSRFNKRLKPARHAARKIDVAAGPLQAQWIRIARGIKKANEALEVDHALQTSVKVGQPKQ